MMASKTEPRERQHNAAPVLMPVDMDTQVELPPPTPSTEPDWAALMDAATD
jgi:hypothetical protein